MHPRSIIEFTDNLVHNDMYGRNGTKELLTLRKREIIL